MLNDMTGQGKAGNSVACLCTKIDRVLFFCVVMYYRVMLPPSPPFSFQVKLPVNRGNSISIRASLKDVKDTLMGGKAIC